MLVRSVRRLAMVAAMALFTLCFASESQAGYRVNSHVYVSPGSYAVGAMGDARNSGNGTEYIGCNVQTSGSWSMIYCMAMDAQNRYLGCFNYDTDPNFQDKLRVLATMNSDSELHFTADGSGRCTSIVVVTASYYTPKGP